MSYGYGQPQYVAYAPPPAYPAPGYGYPARRSAPPSVHVIAILQYVGGVAALLVAAFVGWTAVAVARGPYDLHDEFASPNDAVVFFGVVAGVVALVGLVTIVLGRKLQRGRQWARALVMILSVLSLASVAWSVAVGGTGVSVGAGAVYPLLCLVLLNTPAARSWFRWRTW
jgi:hypothetical protein